METIAENAQTEHLTNEALNQPKPEMYVPCTCCGAILGYKAHIGMVPYLFVFAYPVHGVRTKMYQRRVNVRMLDGDIHCVCCDSWQSWLPAADRPWENKKPR